MCINMLFTEKPKDFKKDFDVVGCYPEYNGKILFLLRHKDKVQGETWCVPGGKVDDGETLAQAALRELKEESGIVATESDIHYFTTIYKVTPTLSYTFSLYSLKLPTLPEITINPTEHTEFTWVTPEESLQMTLIEDEDKCMKMLYSL